MRYLQTAAELGVKLYGVWALKSKKVYSPHQVYLGAFLGGPPCAIYFIYKNFQVMGNAKYASITLLIGAVFFLALLGIVNVLPENLPNMMVPILYSALAGGIVWHFQISKEDEAVNEQFGFISNWQVAKYTAASLVVTTMSLLSAIYTWHILEIG